MLTDFSIDFKVTKQDLEDGMDGSVIRCALALAVKRAVKARFRRWTNVDVIVTSRHVTVLHRKIGGGIDEFRTMSFDEGSDHYSFVVTFDDEKGARADHQYLTGGSFYFRGI